MAWVKIATKATNADGTVSFANLPYGNYRFQQASTKTGYTVDSTQYDITINSTTPVVQSKTNTPTEVGSVKMDKYSLDYPDIKLAGGRFKLMDSTGKTMLDQSAPTDATGAVTFGNLMSVTGTPQSYKIVEVVAPTGYEINTTEQTPSVTVGAETTVSVSNDPTNKGTLQVGLADTNYTQYGLANSNYDIYIDI